MLAVTFSGGDKLMRSIVSRARSSPSLAHPLSMLDLGGWGGGLCLLLDAEEDFPVSCWPFPDGLFWGSDLNCTSFLPEPSWLTSSLWPAMPPLLAKALAPGPPLGLSFGPPRGPGGKRAPSFPGAFVAVSFAAATAAFPLGSSWLGPRTPLFFEGEKGQEPHPLSRLGVLEHLAGAAPPLTQVSQGSPGRDFPLAPLPSRLLRQSSRSSAGNHRLGFAEGDGLHGRAHGHLCCSPLGCRTDRPHAAGAPLPQLAGRPTHHSLHSHQGEPGPQSPSPAGRWHPSWLSFISVGRCPGGLLTRVPHCFSSGLPQRRTCPFSPNYLRPR